MHEGHAAQAGLGMQEEGNTKDKRGGVARVGVAPNEKGVKGYGIAPKHLFSAKIGQRSRAVLRPELKWERRVGEWLTNLVH